MGSPSQWGRRRLQGIPTHVLLAGFGGLIIALLISVLMAYPLSVLPGLWGQLSPIVVGVVLCIVFTSVTVARARDLFEVFGGSVVRRLGGGGRTVARNGQIVVDTSVLIDGRIADIGRTGFVPGTLIVPRFVLNELQHVADSYDSVRRARGRRGLEVLTKLQKESDIPLDISEVDFDDVQDVDAKLVKAAKFFGCAIITNDFNLNRVAELQGVQVLNINELANALKPVFLPGEDLEVRVIQEGKEYGQGIAFLDDGTMVVVESGRRHINSSIGVVVTRVLQTAAGRMIFAHPKAE